MVNATDGWEHETAAALVEAGRRLFARHGYEGTSIRMITSEAGANLGAVTYHFGSKRALYDAVGASYVRPLAEAVERAGSGPGAPLDRIEAVVRAYFEHLHDNADLPRLMLREVLAGRGPGELAAAALQRIMRRISGVVEEGQAEGSIRRGDPVLMGVSIISQPLHLMIAGPVVRAVTGWDPEDRSVRPSVVDHAVEFVRAALAAREGESHEAE